MNRRSLMINPADNVICLLEDAKAGDTVTTPAGESITLSTDVEFAHKASIKDLAAGDPVIKYGTEIGVMMCDAPKGTWIHRHNMDCERGKKINTEAHASSASAEETASVVHALKYSRNSRDTFMGYRRPNGGVGTRNHLLVVPSVFCANTTCEKIAAQIPGAVAMPHAVGCSQVGLDLELTARTLKAMACHPNAAAVLVIGLGCERFNPQELYDAVQETGKPCAKFVIQEQGGITNTVSRAVEIGQKFADEIARYKRVECSAGELMIATKCGGTDATSGLAANPTVGDMADRIIADGGSAILSELNELLGTEKFMAKRAVSPEVARRIYDAVYEIEDLLRSGLDFSLPANRNHLISPGNFDGGVSSIVEKALGGVHKSGTAPFQDVLQYALPPEDGKRGLFLMDYESQDGEVVTGMIGCGAQVVAFTTGRGHATGHPLAPVLKVTGNSKTYAAMTECFDFDASPIISEGRSVEEMGERMLDLVLRTASGELTAAERFGGRELFCVGRRHGWHNKDAAELRAQHPECCC